MQGFMLRILIVLSHRTIYLVTPVMHESTSKPRCDRMLNITPQVWLHWCMHDVASWEQQQNVRIWSTSAGDEKQRVLQSFSKRQPSWQNQKGVKEYRSMNSNPSESGSASIKRETEISTKSSPDTATELGHPRMVLQCSFGRFHIVIDPSTWVS